MAPLYNIRVGLSSCQSRSFPFRRGDNYRDHSERRETDLITHKNHAASLSLSLCGCHIAACMSAGHSVCLYVRFWGVGLPDRCWIHRTKVTSSAQYFVPCERDTVTRCHSIPSPASLPIHLLLVETAIKAIVLSSFKPSHWWTEVQTRITASCIS